MSTVTVLNMNLVSEDSNHKTVPNGPNTCITPGVVAGAPGPIPYPIMTAKVELDPGTKKTEQGGKPTMNGIKSNLKSCNGDEPGTQKDITSFTTAKKSLAFPAPATTVMFEGKPATITGNQGLGNKT
jgi:hypothetical protein